MEKLMNFSNKIDIEFDWHLTNACNFDCAYCFPGISSKKNKSFSRKIDIKQIIKSFDNLGLYANINMSGGEPFLFPDFINLCVGLTKKHHIGLNTNLSISLVEEFAEKININKVSYIWAAIHLDERLKIPNGMEQYAKRFKMLNRQGFNIASVYILHPSKEKVAKKEIDYIKSFGISKLYVKAFKGLFNNKIYPESYSKKMKRILIENSGGYLQNEKYLKGERNFEGLLCVAGCKFFKIWEDGLVQRCASDTKPYGNIYDGTFFRDSKPTKCVIKKVQTLSQCTRFSIL